MKHLCLLGLVLPLAFVSEAGAQSVIRGTIVDAETGEALPAATIQVEGTYRGTITNVDGLYELGLGELGLDALPVTLVIRYIGYETERRVLPASSSDLQNFQLRPVVYEAEEIVITGEDPAIRIMREVIERKKVWRAALETYDAIAYNRFAISNDTGIVSIIETVT
ncbi:MAG: carboxypeptidase-like regulatory domain-containing protein, partial [Rhodothermia bacterium]